MSDLTQAVERAKAQIERDLWDWAECDGVLIGSMPRTVLEAAARLWRTSPDTTTAYAGLDTDEEGGWIPTIFVNRVVVPEEPLRYVEVTVKVDAGA